MFNQRFSLHLAWGNKSSAIVATTGLEDTQKLAMYTSVEEPLSVCSYKVSRRALHLNAGDEIV